jgi:exodeoxyribonuclease VII small subunit
LNKSKEPDNYKDLNAELEVIIGELQAGDIDVDRVLSEYERGINVIEKLEQYLRQAENKVTKISVSSAKTKLK